MIRLLVLACWGTLAAGCLPPAAPGPGSHATAHETPPPRARRDVLQDSLMEALPDARWSPGELPITPGEALHAPWLLCGGPPRAGEGVLAGRVRVGGADGPAAGKTVVAAWRGADSRYAGAGMRPRMRARSDDAGRFLLCGVPRFTPVELSIGEVGREHPAPVRIQLGARVAATLELVTDAPAGAVGASTASRDGSGAASPAPATARLTGRVLTLQGQGLPYAVVVLDRPAGALRTDAEGRFQLDGVPPGVRTVEVRALGFRPVRVGVPVRPGHAPSLDITVDQGVAVLGTLEIRASRRAAWDSTGFEARRRRGAGYFFTAEALEGITDLGTALRLVPGMSGRSSEKSQRLTVGRGGGCLPAFVVNGVRFEPGGSIGPEAMIRAEDIRAMEVYPSRGSTPPEHQRLAACAVVVIWLRSGRE